MSEPTPQSIARTDINWLRIACQKREAERSRCFDLVYEALQRVEGKEAVNALTSLAYKIGDPK